MSSEDKDPLVSATEGVVRGVLGWTEEKLKECVEKFRNRDLVFIRDKDTIQRAKDVRKKGEFAFFKHYVKGKEFQQYRIQFQLGLTLRSLEKKGLDFSGLKNTIFKKYDKQGLHIAQFVQNGIFSKYVGNLLEQDNTEHEIPREIIKVLHNIESTVSFIKKTDDIRQKSKEIVSKIYATSPQTFIISSSGNEAMKKCRKIKVIVMQDISSSYDDELFSSKHKEIYFLNRVNDLAD